jgi:hypothetical protein
MMLGTVPSIRHRSAARLDRTTRAHERQAVHAIESPPAHLRHGQQLEAISSP